MLQVICFLYSFPFLYSFYFSLSFLLLFFILLFVLFFSRFFQLFIDVWLKSSAVILPTFSRWFDMKEIAKKYNQITRCQKPKKQRHFTDKHIYFLQLYHCNLSVLIWVFHHFFSVSSFERPFQLQKWGDSYCKISYLLRYEPLSLNFQWYELFHFNNFIVNIYTRYELDPSKKWFDSSNLEVYTSLSALNNKESFGNGHKIV